MEDFLPISRHPTDATAAVINILAQKLDGDTYRDCRRECGDQRTSRLHPPCSQRALLALVPGPSLRAECDAESDRALKPVSCAVGIHVKPCSTHHPRLYEQMMRARPVAAFRQARAQRIRPRSYALSISERGCGDTATSRPLKFARKNKNAAKPHNLAAFLRRFGITAGSWLQREDKFNLSSDCVWYTGYATFLRNCDI